MEPCIPFHVACPKRHSLTTGSCSLPINRLQGVAKALGSPDDLGPAADLALAAPTALLLPPHTIETRVAALATLLTLPEHAAGELVVTAPRLLTQV